MSNQVNKINKNALRAGTLTAGTAVVLLMSSPAFALTRDDGDDPGPGLSIGQTLGLYVAIPILLFLVIAGLVALGDKSRKRGRAGYGPNSGPVDGSGGAAKSTAAKSDA